MTRKDDEPSYDKRTRQLAQIEGEAFERLTAKQKVVVLNARSAVFAKQKAEESSPESIKRRQAKEKAVADKLAREKVKADRIAALRAASPEAPTPKQVVSKTANFFWGWDVKSSLQGVVLAVALLVQILAQMFITVGLIAPDHPARTVNGAKGFSLFKLIEEARLNLLPFGTMFARRVGAEFDGIRALATRQYVFFAASIGVLVVGAGSVLFGISQLVVGVAHADTLSAVTTSGTGIGGCSLSSGTGNVDTASACIDSLFGTGGAATSLIGGAGLGKMLAAYSSMALVIAGIMVLWTIVSVVADTARTGVPFGKNFNPVWAPIRLIVALGLLVPLGSGLNSGQYIVINLTKWGSQQATAMWSSFAGSIIAGKAGSSGSGSASQSATSGLASAPFSYVQASAMANALFHTLLCQQINNNLCTSGGCSQLSQSSSLVSTSAASQNVSAGSPPANSTTGTSGSSGVAQSVTVNWQTSDSENGGVNCGALQTPMLSATQGNSSADQQAIQSLMSANNANANAFVTAATPAAQQLATLASPANLGQNGKPDITPAAASYANALKAYYAAETSTVASTLSTYNGALNSGLVTSAQQSGWISAPVWLTQVAEQNANVLGATAISPVATGPALDSGGSLASSVDSIVDAYDTANQWTQDSQWQSTVNAVLAGTGAGSTASPGIRARAAGNIIDDLLALTSATANNPLSAVGTYGRALTLAGFTLIEPKEMNYCLSTQGMSDTVKCGGNQRNGTTLGQAQNAADRAFGGGNRTIVPSGNIGSNAQLLLNQDDDPSVHAIMYPIGMIMIAMGFMLIGVNFIPAFRFILGILGWLMLLFVAILAVPLMALSLLAQMGGEGFSTQQFTTDMWMLVGLIIRPILMTLGLLFGLVAFNTIIQITNMIFAPMVANITPASDNSLLSLGIYVMFYASLTYTLANSAFKMIDLMPNWVMNWAGARMETMTDDAAQIQQQSAAYMQTLAYSNKAENVDLSGAKAKNSAFNQQAELARSFQQSGEARYQGPQGQANAWAAAARKMGESNGGNNPPSK